MQRQRAEDELRHLATHDTLTGLPNRVLLNDRLTHALASAKRNGTSVAVFLLDLDHFKDVNDTHGHVTGDGLLKEIASRLRRSARSSDTVTRMGGDEFVVVLEDLNEPEEAAIVATRMLDACSEPIYVLGHALKTPPSIGIAIYPADFGDPESLLKGADLAMYQAKRAGGGTYRYFSQEFYASSVERIELREELGRALDNGELSLYYQPLHDLRDGTICSMEALLRWDHPRLGRVPPTRFVPIAEASGQIVKIGTWVLKTALNQLANWRAEGNPQLTVAVNISAHQLHALDFADVVLNALSDAGLEGNALELELTETAATQDVERAAAGLARLAARGVRIAIDDFGCGYSSFARLRELPINTVKIDRSLVRNIASDPRDAIIVATIVSACRALGLSVVAEGVETEEQMETLKHLDHGQHGPLCCDKAQGFLLSQPLPVAAASNLLQSKHERAPFKKTGS